MSHLAETTPTASAHHAPDLNDRTAREAMTPGAIRVFIKLADAWNLSVANRLTLLGGIAEPTYHRYAKGTLPKSLSRDQLERISLTIGIYKGLVTLFAETASRKRWFTLPNQDAPFCGHSPLDHMLGGGMEHLYQVRRYIDAWRGMR